MRLRHTPDATETLSMQQKKESLGVDSRIPLVFVSNGVHLVVFHVESNLRGTKGLLRHPTRGTRPGGLYSGAWACLAALTSFPCPSSLSPATLRNCHPAEKVP